MTQFDQQKNSEQRFRDWAETGVRKSKIGKLPIAFCLVLAFLCLPEQVHGQAGRLPKRDYYVNYSNNAPYFLADYKDALKRFSRGYNTAVYKLGNRRFLDSVCYLTMMGECHFHMGEYADAINLYEQALRLYLSYQAEGWQARLQMPQLIPANNNAFVQSKINWGVPKRRSAIARVPDTFSMLFGRLDSERALSEGGLVQNAEIYKVDVVEIMRCTALCLHRRREIKGPISKYDPFTNQLVTGLSVAGVGNGSVMGAYNGVLLGIAQASMEDWTLSARTLKSSLQLNGMDHSLTPVALLEMANIAAVTENYSAASNLALEASYLAGIFGQYDLVEEALGIGTTVHLMASRSAYPPLENAIKWASFKKAKLLQASLTVKLAECFAEAGDAKTSAAWLGRANQPISNRNSLPNAVVSARLKYVGAVIHFLKGDFRKGSAALIAALKHFQKGSRWLYQLGLADQLVVSGSITHRQGELLYTALLRDPTDLDWRTDPLEAIAFLASAHVGPMERWFDIVVSRLNHQRALEISDLVRRHRFFSYLPLGGRLMAFRWMVHAPPESLTQNALAQRTKFLNSNTQYKLLYDRANLIRKELLALPVKPVPQSPEDVQQIKLLKQLAAISQTQEAILASYALRREPAEMVFPPQGNMSELQQLMRPDQLALVSLETASGYHSFLMNSQAVQYVGLSDGRNVLRSVAGLLKEAGLMEVVLDVKTLQEEEWKESARQLKVNLFGESSDASWSVFKELVVVPDGVLWYLPFEILPVGEADDEKFLSELVNIRYSPTLFLAFGPQRPVRPLERSVVVTARMHQRGESDLSKLEFESLVKKMPEAIKFDTQVKVPSNYLASLFDQLVIWSEIKSTKNLPLAMMPMQIDQSKTGTSIEAWMSLPWAGPEHIVMPGFHSDGGGGLRRKLNGTDLFLTSIGLMASGSRTALISRWATGGKTSLALTGEYASKLAKLGPTRAILESRQSTREMVLDYENEPRIRFKKSDPVLKAEHPFFWASHMLFGIPDNSPPPADDDVQPVANDGGPADANDDGAKPGGADGNKDVDGNPDGDKAADKPGDKAADKAADKAGDKPGDKPGEIKTADPKEIKQDQ
jgi:tetratricopeptide (TPR) repeat protein